MPLVAEFFTSWMALFSHSSKAKFLWKELTGKAMASYSATRWWSKWEIFNQLLVQFGDIEPFLRINSDLGPVSRQKLVKTFEDAQKLPLLKLELASIVDWGKVFVEATYILEGDGPLAFTCYEIMQTIVSAIQVANTFNVDAIVKSISPLPTVQQQLKSYSRSCIQPGLDYFNNHLHSSLKTPLAAFKAALLLCPHKVNSLKPTSSDVDSLEIFPFISPTSHIPALKEELATYLSKADGVDITVDTLQWWKQYESSIPAWAASAKKVLTVQLSSAAAECVFSILNSFNDQQDNSLQDYIEASVMLRFNRSAS